MNNKRQIAVIGSGLAGLTSALTASESTDSLIYIFESQSNIGGNSKKASSGFFPIIIIGINATPSPHQPPGDSVDLFLKDTLSSGHGLSNPKLVDILVQGSSSALEWLSSLSSQELDLDTVTRCGGHSHARTNRNTTGPNVGTMIIQALQKEIINQPNIKLETDARVVKLIWSENSQSAIGLIWKKDDQEYTLMTDSVILATGGFAASQEMISIPSH
jgi:aspartate oxidase